MTDNKARRLTVVRTSSDVLRLDEGELVHVGVDVHKATDHVAVSSGSRGLLATWVPARPAGSAHRAAAADPEAGRPGRLRGRAHRIRASRPRSSPPPSCSP